MPLNARVLAPALLLITGALAHADEIDDFVKSYMAERNIPGCVVAVVKDYKIVRQRAYGLASVELNVPVTLDTQFEIGSVSKQFTAAGIMMLVEEGKLKLDDTLDKFVEGIPDAWKPVTVKQLLSHTSGIPDIEEIFGYDSYRLQFTTPEIIKVANSKPMDFKPGDSWHYSNTGYYLLSIVIEKVVAKPYGQFLTERIFTPLGMTKTREADPFSIIPNRAAGYQIRDGVLKNRDAVQPSSILGAGALTSTVGDLAKWDAALYSEKILKKSSLEEMWAPAKMNDGKDAPYGYGWFPETHRRQKSVWHSGGTAGFSCVVRRYPEKHVSVFVLCNLYATGVGPIALRAADTVIPGLSWVSATPSPDPDPAARDIILKAMADVGKGGAESKYVAPGMWKEYSQAARDAWKERMAGMKSFEFLHHEKYDLREVVTGEKVTETFVYRLTTDKGKFYITFMLTPGPDRKIGLQFREDY